jgi:hypothetical protein
MILGFIEAPFFSGPRQYWDASQWDCQGDAVAFRRPV